MICEQEPTLSVERILSTDGEVVLPIIGVVNLGGKYIVEAEDELQRIAGKKLNSDSIRIAITLVQDASSPVQYAGAVAHYGTAPFVPGMTLDDIVKVAQPNPGAAIEAVEISASDGHKVVVDLNKGGGQTRLRAGDRIFFPQAMVANEVIVLGGVDKPGSKEYKTDMTVRDLVALAGGVTGHGQASKTRLERKGGEAKTFDLESEEGLQKLQRGDIVTIPIVDNPRLVTVAGLVWKPGLIEFREGMTLTQAIKAAGGVNAFGDPNGIVVKRIGEWKHKYDLARIEAGKDQDLVLKPADIIEVYAAKPKTPSIKKPDQPRKGPVVPPL